MQEILESNKDAILDAHHHHHHDHDNDNEK